MPNLDTLACCLGLTSSRRELLPAQLAPLQFTQRPSLVFERAHDGPGRADNLPDNLLPGEAWPALAVAACRLRPVGG
jgi:hypothetical protein